jgi:L-ascorbate metabolism protein UlaG (beta-lactamase superfamily)
MTRDEIIRMAREAGMERTIAIHKNGAKTVELPDFDSLTRFAALVAAAEREACAKLADERLMDTSLLMSLPPKSSAAWSIAAVIRARGQE